MNERIYQLIEQADEQGGDDPDIRDQVFAELIIRECCDVIQKEVSLKYKNGGEDEEFMNGHYAASLLSRVKIKEHFGVTE